MDPGDTTFPEGPPLLFTVLCEHISSQKVSQLSSSLIDVLLIGIKMNYLGGRFKISSTRWLLTGQEISPGGGSLR